MAHNRWSPRGKAIRRRLRARTLLGIKTTKLARSRDRTTVLVKIIEMRRWCESFSFNSFRIKGVINLSCYFMSTIRSHDGTDLLEKS